MCNALDIINFIGIANKTKQNIAIVTEFLDLIAEDLPNWEITSGEDLFNYYLQFLKDVSA